MVNVIGSHQSYINSGGDIFLWNKQIFVGVNRRGCHGTDTGTINTNGTITSGPTFDLSGRTLGITGVGLCSLTVNNSIIPDYFLPGGPFEAFGAGYKTAGGVSNVGSASRSGPSITNITDYSSNDLSTSSKLIGYYTGKIATNLKIELTYSIEPSGSIVRVDVKMNNLSASETIYDVRFSRQIDPDNNQFISSSFDTIDTIKVQNGKDASNNNSTLYSQIESLHRTGVAVPALTLSSTDPSSYVYLGGSTNPYGLTIPGNNAGSTQTGDFNIGFLMTYGNISPLQSSTKTYYVGFGAVSDITNEINEDNNNGSGIGDPFIHPLFGPSYYLPNDEDTYLLFNNKTNLQIYCKNWLVKIKDTYLSFMKYLLFNFYNQKFILDLDKMVLLDGNFNKINLYNPKITINHSKAFSNYFSDYYGKKYKLTKFNKQYEFVFELDDYKIYLLAISDLGYPDIRNNLQFKIIDSKLSHSQIKNFDGALIAEHKVRRTNDVLRHKKII